MTLKELRQQLTVHCPITFDMVCLVWGEDRPNLANDTTREGFFAVWALMVHEWSEAMIRELNEPTGGGIHRAKGGGSKPPGK